MAGGRPPSRPVAEIVDVVAAVIERDGRYLITRRLERTHLAGLWEFPGGKIGSAEAPETALRRELKEELGVDATVGDLVEAVTWSYPEKTVRILFFRCALQRIANTSTLRRRPPRPWARSRRRNLPYSDSGRPRS